jgi:vanillate O-demethylase ferredoxin subunit
MNAQGKSFELHCSVKHISDLAFKQVIKSLAGERAHFYASAEPGKSRLDLHQIVAPWLSETHLYVCGPMRLIIAVQELAREQGWPLEQIHVERFGVTSQPDDRAVTLELARSGKTIDVATTSTLLDTLLDQGLAIPHDCKHGECSLCRIRVLEGEPDHRDLCLSPQEQARSMCVCVSRGKRNWLKLDF